VRQRLTAKHDTATKPNIPDSANISCESETASGIFPNRTSGSNNGTMRQITAALPSQKVASTNLGEANFF
jgi:hypothetical protein